MNLKPKIAVIGLKGLPAFGGAATVGENIIMGLKDKFDFTVFSSRPYTDLATGNYNGIKQIVFDGKSKSAVNTLLYYLKSMLYCLFIGKFNLVHLHHAESGFITPFLRIRYKVITTFHGIFFNKIDPKFNNKINTFFRFAERLNLRYSNLVTSVSLIDATDIGKHYNKKINYVPNGIRLNKKVEKSEQEYIFFAAARIYEIKGLDILLDALKIAKRPVKLKVAGDIDQVPEYKRIILEKSKDLDIEYLGLIKDKDVLLGIMNNAKLFIFPSLYEAMSMMLIEAASKFTPIIASDIPANKAIFSEDEVLFFRSNDCDDLAAKINFSLVNYNVVTLNAAKAYKKLETEFDLEIISKRYKDLYYSIL